MIELAILVGLGAVGYLLAADQSRKDEQMPQRDPLELREQFDNPITFPSEDKHGDVKFSQENTGHSNEVPYFGARVTQSTHDGGTNGILDSHAGIGTEYFQKKEVRSFFDAKPGSGNPFGQPTETEFMQSRMVSSNTINNVFPIQPTLVGPGGDDGYTNAPKGGYQMDHLRQYQLPKTTDETRVVGKPKLTFEPPMMPGKSLVTNAGIHAEVYKNKPDKFVLLGMDRVNTAVGAQIAPAIYPNQPMKTQARETTGVIEHFGPGAPTTKVNNYIRAFTEPFQEFMRLTAEGRPGPAGNAGASIPSGIDNYSAQTKRNEQVFIDAARMQPGTAAMPASAENLGSFKYKEPLDQGINVTRMDKDILKAYKQNPYTQTLDAY